MKNILNNGTFIKKSIVLALVLILAFSCLLFVSACKDKDDKNDYPSYDYYRDVPNLTNDEIVAIQKLKNDLTSSKESLVLGMTYTSEAFIHNGKSGGYALLLSEWMSSFFDIPLKLVIVDSLTELFDGLEDGTIDFTADLTITEERKQLYHMSDTITERSYKQFRLTETKLSDISKSRKIKYGSLKGSMSATVVKNALGDSVEINDSFVDVEDVKTALYDGTIDVFCEDGCIEAIFDGHTNIVSEAFYPLTYQNIGLTAKQDRLKPMITVMDKYLEQGALYHLTILYNKGNNDYLKHKFVSILDDEEKAYLDDLLDNNKTISYLAETDNYPASFYNEQENEFQGIAIDVIKAISELTGISFEHINQPDATWTVLQNALSSGEAKFITELIRSEERLSQFIWANASYSSDRYALISLTETDNIQMNQVMYSKIGLLRGSAYYAVFTEWFPNHKNTKIYDTTDEAFAALEKGEIEFVMASQNLLLSMTNYREKPGFKANLTFNQEHHSVFGFNKEETVLCSIMSKAQGLIDVQTVSDSWTRRVFDYRGKMLQAQIPYLVAAAIALAAALVLLFLFFMKNKQTNVRLEKTIKERTADLEELTHTAQSASRAKSDFLARMSHEIRTPLNAIIGMTQVAKQLPGQPEKSKDSLEEILTASDHLLGILNDVLDMSKIESGKFTLSVDDFNLKTAMLEVAGIIKQRCKERAISFTNNCDELPSLSVTGDKLRLKQVLINLLGNAVKFTPEDGNIDFIIENNGQTEKEITLTFTVKDNGIGMSEQQVSKLFVAFEQADSSIAIKFGGTGLGLAISQNLVEQMGGKITVESQLEKGSTFTFTLSLPLAEVPQAETESLADENLDLTGKKILLVEDIEINRIILTQLLFDTNAVFEEAEDGLVATRMFEDSAESYYDLILMDVQMPNMNGYDATKYIRALDRNDAKEIPIIALTANAYNEDIQRAKEYGMNDHLSKPINISEVRNKLAQYLLK